MHTPPRERQTVQSYSLIYTCKYNRLTSVLPRYVQSAGSLSQAGGCACAWSSTMHVNFIILPIRNLPATILFCSHLVFFLQSESELLATKTGCYTLGDPFGILLQSKINLPAHHQDRLLYPSVAIWYSCNKKNSTHSSSRPATILIPCCSFEQYMCSYNLLICIVLSLTVLVRHACHAQVDLHENTHLWYHHQQHCPP